MRPTPHDYAYLSPEQIKERFGNIAASPLEESQAAVRDLRAEIAELKTHRKEAEHIIARLTAERDAALRLQPASDDTLAADIKAISDEICGTLQGMIDKIKKGPVIRYEQCPSCKCCTALHAGDDWVCEHCGERFDP